MRFDIYNTPSLRQMRPTEKIRLSMDFTNDVGTGGDSPLTPVTSAAAQDDPGTDLSGSLLVGQGLVGNVLSVTLQNPPGGHTYLVLFRITTASGFIYEHDVALPVHLDA